MVLPAALERFGPARPVWQNELGGLTVEVLGAGLYVKWDANGCVFDAEVQRLRWARRFTTVPRVVEQGRDEDGSWLVTEALPGENAVTARWRADPARAVAAVGAGLRALHDALPVAVCPFTWSAGERVEDARARAADGRLDAGRWLDEHSDLPLEAALAELADPPPVDVLVVCHGDACAPNTLVLDDGSCSGHVDLGDLGVADRWADLAVATLSTQWNYGPGWEEPLLEAYGVAPDPERTAYYRLLWDIGP